MLDASELAELPERSDGRGYQAYKEVRWTVRVRDFTMPLCPRQVRATARSARTSNVSDDGLEPPTFSV